MKDRTNGTDDSDHRLAVLIDADNAQPAVVKGLLDEVARYGVASVKRIYGDFTSNQQSQWKKVLLEHSIQPMQQFAYTTGKNATDSSLIIDAMDLLYTGRFQGFCLVSSDSDFTRLAQRLREGGMTVYGFGEKKTPQPFVQACDKFVYTEILRPAPSPETPPKATPAKPKKAAARPAAPPAAAAPTATPVAKAASPASAQPLPAPLPLIRQAIEEAADDQGWAPLGAVGNYLNKISPDFDARLYGSRKLSDLIRHHPKHFVLEERGTPGTPGAVIYVRDRGSERTD